MEPARHLFFLLRVSLAMVLGGAPAATSLAAEPSRPVNVVLVHGIYDRGKIFDPMVRVLEAHGCRCFAPSLTPNDCSHGVHALALQLAHAIDARFGRSQPVILIGFSMGGLVTRDYVQNLARPERVRGVFLISDPRITAPCGRRLRGAAAGDLGLHSAFLQALDQHTQVWRHIPVCSYWTPCDLMIVPATNCRWDGGRHQGNLLPVASVDGQKPRTDGRMWRPGSPISPSVSNPAALPSRPPLNSNPYHPAPFPMNKEPAVPAAPRLPSFSQMPTSTLSGCGIGARDSTKG